VKGVEPSTFTLARTGDASASVETAGLANAVARDCTPDCTSNSEPGGTTLKTVVESLLKLSPEDLAKLKALLLKGGPTP
jgi:hypothetical protein